MHSRCWQVFDIYDGSWHCNKQAHLNRNYKKQKQSERVRNRHTLRNSNSYSLKQKLWDGLKQKQLNRNRTMFPIKHRHLLIFPWWTSPVLTAELTVDVEVLPEEQQMTAAAAGQRGSEVCNQCRNIWENEILILSEQHRLKVGGGDHNLPLPLLLLLQQTNLPL